MEEEKLIEKERPGYIIVNGKQTQQKDNSNYIMAKDESKPLVMQTQNDQMRPMSTTQEEYESKEMTSSHTKPDQHLITEVGQPVRGVLITEYGTLDNKHMTNEHDNRLISEIGAQPGQTTDKLLVTEIGQISPIQEKQPINQFDYSRPYYQTNIPYEQKASKSPIQKAERGGIPQIKRAKSRPSSTKRRKSSSKEAVRKQANKRLSTKGSRKRSKEERNHKWSEKDLRTTFVQVTQPPSTKSPSNVDSRFKAMKTEEKCLGKGARYMARVYGKSQSIKKQTYFHGLLPRNEVDKLLKRNGDFLIRTTNYNGKTVPCLDVRSEKKIQHFIISRTPKKRYYIGIYSFDCVPDLVDWYLSTKSLLSEESGVMLGNGVERYKWQLNHEQIRILDKLAEGTFGEVHRALLVQGPKYTEVAVKISREGTTDRQQILAFIEEFKIMHQFSHKHVVKVYGVAAEQEPLMIVMEYCPGGSLASYLRKNTITIRLQERMRFCKEAAAGLTYLEKKKCLHRDVAARNCLLGALKEIKIADFGQSLFMVTYKEEKGTNVPIRWLAPETLRTGTFTPATDVWSFGILMWEVFSDGAQPYTGMTNTQVRQKVASKCYRMKKPMGMPEVVENLIDKCWNEIPNDRPTFSKIYKKLTGLVKSRYE